jgi:hypothetical protein
MDIIVWVLMVQLWTYPPPAIKLMYTKEFATYEECMRAREEYMPAYVAICGQKVKKQ